MDPLFCRRGSEDLSKLSFLFVLGEPLSWRRGDADLSLRGDDFFESRGETYLSREEVEPEDFRVGDVCGDDPGELLPDDRRSPKLMAWHFSCEV